MNQYTNQVRGAEQLSQEFETNNGRRKGDRLCTVIFNKVLEKAIKKQIWVEMEKHINHGSL